MTRVNVGDAAPDVTLVTHTGEEVSLASYRGKQAVVLFFYPRDGTPVCTKEACSFRDAYEDFVEAGAAVIGISGDSADRHRSFASNHQLPFLLASDKDGRVRSAFGVPKSMGFLPGRVTYVIDKEGTVRLVFSSQLSADRHVSEALDTVRKLMDETERNRQVFTVEGMSCEGCKGAVAAAIQGLPGVESVDVSLEKGEAVVLGSADQVTEQAVVAAVEQAGYKARPAGAGQSSPQ